MYNINNLHLYLAHEESLEEHFKLTLECAKEDINNMNIDKYYKEFVGVVGYDDIFKELLEYTIELHDLGKVSKDFQFRILGNTNFSKHKTEPTDHSRIGSVLYVDYCFEILDTRVKDYTILDKFYVFVFINAFIISKHHNRNNNWFSLEELYIYLREFNYKSNTIDRISTDSYRDYKSYLLGKYNIEEAKYYLHNTMEYVVEDLVKLDVDILKSYLRVVHNILVKADIEATIKVKEEDFDIPF